jgi:hypothetical protein
MESEILFYPLDLIEDCRNILIKDLGRCLHKDTWFVFSSVREEYDYEILVRYVDDLSKILLSKGFSNIVYFVNNGCPDHLRTSYMKVIEWSATDLLYRLKYRNTEYNHSWNPNSNKALFLTLKSNKIHRVGLLYKFIEAGMINSLDYSFYPFHGLDVEYNDGIDTEAMYKMISNKDDFEVFAKLYARSIDNIADPLINTTSHITSGYPYSIDLYKNTSLSIVSETLWGQRNIYLTEKIWKPIVNHHPFIIAGQPGTLKFLNKLGFKTFEEYMKIKNYDEETDHLIRLYNIVENTKFFLEHFHKFKDQIKKDIDYNFQQFFELCQNQRNDSVVLQDEKFFERFSFDLLYENTYNKGCYK